MNLEIKSTQVINKINFLFEHKTGNWYYGHLFAEQWDKLFGLLFCKKYFKTVLLENKQDGLTSKGYMIKIGTKINLDTIKNANFITMLYSSGINICYCLNEKKPAAIVWDGVNKVYGSFETYEQMIQKLEK